MREAAKTSKTHPIYVNWILETLPGKIGLTLAPGKHGTSKEDGGRWERDLNMDLDKLVADGMKVQVCLLQDHELVRLKIPTLIESAERRGVRVLRLPIEDGGVLPSKEPVEKIVQEILAAARNGENVVIHCMGGLGRAGTIGGCTLVRAGFTVEQALATLRAKRGKNCPETEGQRRFIRDFAG